MYDRVKVTPIPISTAGGVRYLDEVGKIRLEDGTVLEGYVNPYLSTALLSEGGLSRFYGWEFHTVGGTKTVHTTKASVDAARQGNLWYMPEGGVETPGGLADMDDLYEEYRGSVCTAEAAEIEEEVFGALGHGQESKSDLRFVNHVATRIVEHGSYPVEAHEKHKTDPIGFYMCMGYDESEAELL